MSQAVPDHDAAMRRQLRFSLFLQGFAGLMMGGAMVVRVVAFGWDALALILLAAFLLIVAAVVYTVRRLRDMGPVQ
jgi:hypothetical protein